MEFTGTPDTDKLILLALDDKSFSALCSVSRYTRSLCNEALWADRFALKYGVTLWQYGVSHRDVYIEFSKLYDYLLLGEVVKRGFINMLERLLVSGHELNWAFQYAVLYNNIPLTELLLDKGANIHDGNDEAIRAAARHGYLEMVRILIKRGANINSGRDSALLWAQMRRHYEIVELLLENGAIA